MCDVRRVSCKFPSLAKEGWPRPSTIMSRCILKKGPDGVVCSTFAQIHEEPKQTAPSARGLRWLRDIFLSAQPPLLSQGGEFSPRYQLFGSTLILIAMSLLLSACHTPQGTSEVAEIRIPKGAGGVGFLPLLVME